MEDKLRGVKQKMADGFDLPKEVVTDVPKISMIGNSEVTIENHKGIIAFDNDKMKVKTRLGNLVIEGKGIEILFIGGSTITISGSLNPYVMRRISDMNLNFLKTGTVKVEVRVFKREQLLNVLWNNGIKIHNIKKIDVSTIVMEINYKDYKFVREVVKKLQGKITIVSAKGGIFVISRMKKRIGIVVGLVLFLGILYYLSGFIWRIEIETKRFLAPYEVRQQLKEVGIKPGISKNGLDVYSLEKTMENLNGDIMWVNARKEGSTLKIKIEEKINPPVKEQEEKVENVTATMDGEVKKIFTTSGTAAVKPGDVVKKGDVLILPQEGKEGFQYEVPAKGKVMANTFYEKIIELQVEGAKEERTGNTDYEIYWEFNNKKIYLKKPIKAFESYDKIEEEGKYIHKNIYYEKTSKDITEPKEEIINKAVDFLYNSTMKEVTKQAKLVDKVVTVEELGNGKILLKVLFIIEQDIALNY